MAAFASALTKRKVAVKLERANEQGAMQSHFYVLRAFVLHLPHLAKAALANTLFVLEQVLADR